MSLRDIQVNVAYVRIGNTHLLIHLYCRKMIDHWALYDLEDLSSKSGKSIDEVLDILCRKREA